MDDRLKIKNYIQKIIDNPRPFSEQWHIREGKYDWCSDWEIIEVLKYFLNGHDGYMGDPPPNRLKGNPMFSKDKIAAQCKFLLNHHKDIDSIIERLKEERQRGAT